ncbi:MAG TPA: aldehyde ferredoxin oxidoreductase N-terminal domain-containing protein [Ktedonobacteraceae bacterium]
MALAVLLVHEDGADIKPATDLWGQYTQQTNHTIRDREHGEVEDLSIGPTGENLVRFACAVHSWDKSHDGVAGHGGLGAATGANHLKVVAVTGNRQTTVVHPDAIKTLLNDIREPMKVGTASLKNYAENVLSV